MAKYRIRNYGNTRKLPYKRQYYEIPRNGFIETNNAALAKALGEFQFVDVERIDTPVKKRKKKSKKKKPSERKVAAKKKSKKTKRCKRKKLKGK